MNNLTLSFKHIAFVFAQKFDSVYFEFYLPPNEFIFRAQAPELVAVSKCKIPKSLLQQFVRMHCLAPESFICALT